MSTTVIEEEIKTLEKVDEDIPITIEDTTTTTDDNSTLMHHLIVKSLDGSISNMICPIEILFNAKDMQQPLIPIKYDPEIFYAISAQKHFINSSNHTSHGNIHKKRHHRHHRHHKRSEDNKRMHATPMNNNLPLKRRKLEKPNMRYYNNSMNEGSEESVDSDWRSDSYDNIYSDRSLVNSRHMNRPRRSTRKNISYKEADPSVPQYRLIPMSKYPVGNRMLNEKKEIFVNMSWVQCDRCSKWRRIPTSVEKNELSGEWFCENNRWDVHRNTCSADEEVFNAKEEHTLNVSEGDEHSKKLLFYRKLNELHVGNVSGVRVFVGGKNVDFYELYEQVIKRGGFYCCNSEDESENLFAGIFRCMSCFSLENVREGVEKLPEIYEKYLLDYEKKYFVAGDT